MLFTYLIYFLIVTLMTTSAFCYLRVPQRLSTPLLYLSVIIVSFIIGFRYEVGTDWNNYRDIFEASYSLFGFNQLFQSNIEPLYLFINKLLSSTGFNFYSIFFLVGFIQIFLIVKVSVRFSSLLPLLLFLFFTSGTFLSFLNIQRQALAFVVFLYSIKFIINKSLFKYLICCFIAMGFHTSALILIPLYFINTSLFSLLDNRVAICILYVLAFYLSPLLLDAIYYVIQNFVPNAKYLRTLDLIGDKEIAVSSGYGIIAQHVMNIWIIFYSKHLTCSFERYNIKVYIRIFILGLLLANMVGLDGFLGRLPYYMVSLKFIIIAFLIYYLYANSSNTLLKRGEVVLGVSCWLALFIVSIYNSANGASPFNFNF